MWNCSRRPVGCMACDRSRRFAILQNQDAMQVATTMQVATKLPSSGRWMRPQCSRRVALRTCSIALKEKSARRRSPK